MRLSRGESSLPSFLRCELRSLRHLPSTRVLESPHPLMTHVLGIDAGGTKTVCLLADEQGSIVAEARGGGGNLQAAGELEVEKVLHRVMEDAIGDRAVVPSAICLGIAGVDRPDDSAIV